MFNKSEAPRYGFLIDIGSGSVAFGIVKSSPGKAAPELLWETREYIPVKELKSVDESSRAIVSTLTDMALTVSGDGLSALRKDANDKSARISETQVTISAPWSYCVSQPIKYEQDEPFHISHGLISELARAAGEEAVKIFQETHPELHKEIVITSKSVLNVTASGYRLDQINGQQSKDMQMNQITTLVNRVLYDAVKELNNKLFSGVPLHVTGNLLAFYKTARDIKPHKQDVCLINVTSEATQLGIVRDGSLKYCTHTSFGSASIAREFANATGSPLAEVRQSLDRFNKMSPTHDTVAIVNAYVEKISELFKETGDALSIPRIIYLLAEPAVIDFLSPLIEKAGSSTTKSPVVIYPASELTLSKDKKANDNALQIASYFFHTQQGQLHFEYL